ncbi:unnamed protein product [Musa acuminata subsp. burmannicoides]|uniref:(wild Malaysian banana) hypothetical protein n=1 Tax=Musa acuminata subsp. malaccensis TaxID=214687 RepID=A0A8D7B1W6_MUSAM|nr:unnamed protein product [Musa acuminata subsp. malaccensis]CAG1860417.1 unnamed protein product [Musa acuminata subsp. malaccensis]
MIKTEENNWRFFMLHLLSDDSDVCMICRQPGFLCREVCFTIRTTFLSRDISQADKHHNNALIFLACTL